MRLQDTITATSREPGRWRRALLLHSVLWALTALFFGTFFDRFAGLRSGSGEFSGGMALLRGYLPYRDYFTAGPPLNILKAALLIKLFGPTLIAVRLAAVVERLVLASLLLCWLQQLAKTRYAAVATFLAITLSAGDRTDPLASYNHDALFWAVAAGLLASLALRRDLSRRGLAGLGCLSGACAAFSLLTKQTVGGLIAMVLLVLPSLLLGRVGPRRGIAWFAGFIAGVVPPLALVCIVLHRFHILRPALAMLFITGPSAKAGHPGDFLLRWGLVGADNAGWVVLGMFWCTLAWAAGRPWLAQTPVIVSEPAGSTPASPPTGNWLTRASGAVLLLVGASEALQRLPALHDMTKSVVYATLLGLGWLVTRGVRLCMRTERTMEAEQLLLMATCSSAAAVALSLSWPAFEAMLLPGLGLLLSLLLAGCSTRARPYAYGILAFLFFMQLREKLDLPFGFDLQDEGSVVSSRESSRLPELEGMRLPETTVHFIDDTTKLIREHTCQGDAVFTFPEMGLLYTLSDRWPPTWSPSHNVDVVNDALAAQDAARILTLPPAVLITYRETSADWSGAERLWRKGRPSGQRELAQAVDALTRAYELKGSYMLRDEDPKIDVYLRRDASVERAQACLGGDQRPSRPKQGSAASKEVED